MAALSSDPPKKNTKMLYVGIFIVVAIVIVAAAATLVYFYMDGQYKQKMAYQESLRQAFSDQLNLTNESYAQIAGYVAAPNNYYADEYRTWVDGYIQRAGDYSATVDLLLVDAAAYKQAIGSEDGNYANVSRACDQANNTVRSLNDTIKGYEADYQSRLAMKANASGNYEAAVRSSKDFYNAAWNQMHNETTHIGSGFYHKFLNDCRQNITSYNQSIELVQNTGATYQNFLKGTDFYVINDTVSRLRGNVTKLEDRYKELLANIPNATVYISDLNTAINTEGKLTKVQNFQVYNNDFPWQISDVVVHFKLVDVSTGTVRSTADVNVEMATGVGISRYVYQAVMECDYNRDYEVRYTITYEY